MFVGKLRLTMDRSVGMHHWSRSLISTQLLMIIKCHTNPSPERQEQCPVQFMEVELLREVLTLAARHWACSCANKACKCPTNHRFSKFIKSVIFLSSSNHSQHLEKIKKSASANITKTDQSSETPLCIWYIHVLVYKLCIIFLSKLNFRNGCNWTRVRNGIFMLTVYTSFM